MAKRIQKKEGLRIRLVNVLIFLLVFNLLSIPLYIAMYTNFSFEPLKQINAEIVSATLRLFGFVSHSEDSIVDIATNNGTQKIEISWDSTGWKSMYAVAALILATPAVNISKKLKAALVSVGIIFAVNFLRITTTILISATFGFKLFDIVHTVLWREGLILAVIVVWVLWMRMEKYKIWKIK